MYIKVMQQKAKIIEVDKYITIMFCGLSFNRIEIFFLNSLRHAKEEDQTTSKVLI